MIKEIKISVPDEYIGKYTLIYNSKFTKLVACFDTQEQAETYKKCIGFDHHEVIQLTNEIILLEITFGMNGLSEDDFINMRKLNEKA